MLVRSSSPWFRPRALESLNWIRQVGWQVAYGLLESLFVGDFFTQRSGFGSGAARRRSNVEFGSVHRSKDRLTSHREGKWVAVHCRP
ncbi:unnamed protein product [Macrosiphum euphorbiae]|uniref:Uncharacterized protein n=1 Tax=Macrosiphum euphorbiae TaxID=13131 RepID=A0AAV0XN15_9HEMI|nr:unnamed protein product [Macrosiphum euphorbiae]